MLRSMSRVVVAAFVLALTVCTVPAQAQPMAMEIPALEAADSWFGAALAWLRGLLGTDTGAEGPMQKAVAAGSLDTGSLIESGAQPTTGSCIDPQGGGRWCS